MMGIDYYGGRMGVEEIQLLTVTGDTSRAVNDTADHAPSFLAPQPCTQHCRDAGRRHDTPDKG